MTLAPGMQVVVIASKAGLDRCDEKKLEALVESGVDWDTVLMLSQLHGVFPRVWQHISANWSEHISAEVAARQNKLLRDNFFSAVYLTRHLFLLLDVFQEHNLYCIPYKGPVLASYFYDDVSLRSYGDLDILIAREDLAQVIELLIEQGYTPEIEVPPGQLRLYSRIEDDLAFVNDRGVCVEVHWELSGKYLHKPMGLELVVEDVTPVNILGRKIPVFSDEHLLIYCCLHGVRHGWSKLDLVSCVAQILFKRNNLNWQYVLKLVEEYSCRRMLFVGLLLAEKLYGVAMPHNIYEEVVGDAKAVSLSHGLYKSNFCMCGAHERQKHLIAGQRFSLLRLNVRDSMVDKVRYVGRLLFVPSKAEWRAVALPDVFACLYYLIRPFRVVAAVIWGGGRAMWHKII